MGNDADYQDLLDDEIDLEGPLLEEFPRTRSARGDKDYRRAIEELREEKRLRDLLTDFDIDDM